MNLHRLSRILGLLALLGAMPSFAQSMPARSAKVTPSPAREGIEKSQPTGLDVLRNALVQVCTRHPAVERCFLVLAQGSDQHQAGIWFVPIFDGKVDNTALGEAQQVYLKLFPTGGQLPMMLLSRQTWRKQMAGVGPIYVRKAK